MATPVTGDLLGAASLALGALAIFYSLWSPELNAASNIEKKRARADRDPDIVRVEGILHTRAWPLALSAVIVSALLAPPSLGVLKDAGVRVWTDGLQALGSYDAVQALLVAVWAGVLGLAWLSVTTVIGLQRKVAALSQQD